MRTDSNGKMAAMLRGPPASGGKSIFTLFGCIYKKCSERVLVLKHLSLHSYPHPPQLCILISDILLLPFSYLTYVHLRALDRYPVLS